MLQIFGQVEPPAVLNNFGSVSSGGPGNLINLILNLMVAVAGIYALFNFILAGYGFLSAGDDPKSVAGAWSKIYQSAIGLAVAAGAFILAALFGWLILGSSNAILSPTIPTP